MNRSKGKLIALSLAVLLIIGAGLVAALTINSNSIIVHEKVIQNTTPNQNQQANQKIIPKTTPDQDGQINQTTPVKPEVKKTVEMTGPNFQPFVSRCLSSDPGDYGAGVVSVKTGQTVTFSFQVIADLDQNVTYLYEGQPWDGKVWGYIQMQNPGNGSFTSSIGFIDNKMAPLDAWNILQEPVHYVNFTVSFQQPGDYTLIRGLDWAGEAIASIGYHDQGSCLLVNVHVT